jgi:outer membrane lipoprotein SlyB
MKIWRNTTKVFALFFSLFVSFSSVFSQSDSIYRLPVGTKIRVQMDNEINSEAYNVNDTFTVTVYESLKFGEVMVLSVGTIIEGRIIGVEKASLGGKNGKLSVRFETLRLETGETRSIEGSLVKELKAESPSKTNLLMILGGTAVGAIVGAAFGAENGAVLGAGIGAGAGTGFALARKGKDVRIKADEKFEIILTREVVLPVKSY